MNKITLLLIYGEKLRIHVSYYLLRVDFPAGTDLHLPYPFIIAHLVLLSPHAPYAEKSRLQCSLKSKIYPPAFSRPRPSFLSLH